MMQVFLSLSRPRGRSRFFVSLLLYVGAIAGGIVVGTQIVPDLLDGPLGSHLPIGTLDEKLTFGYGCLIRSAHVMMAGMLAGIFGFFMREDGALRALTLTLPLWTSTLYMAFYILLSLR